MRLFSSESRVQASRSGVRLMHAIVTLTRRSAERCFGSTSASLGLDSSISWRSVFGLGASSACVGAACCACAGAPFGFFASLGGTCASAILPLLLREPQDAAAGFL